MSLKNSKKYRINRPATSLPPGRLKPSEIPQFVVFGFDDNGFSGLNQSEETGAMEFILNLFSSKKNPGSGYKATYDNEKISCSFYNSTHFIENRIHESPVYIKKQWRKAYEQNHEIGNHGHHHQSCWLYSKGYWKKEIIKSTKWLTKAYNPFENPDKPDSDCGLGIPQDEIIGFRSPFLEYNRHLFPVLRKLGFFYDCSIEEGHQLTQDGRNYLWPYTLDTGSPGDEHYIKDHKNQKAAKTKGLWEIPVYQVIAPPDSLCEKYNIKKGFRDRLKQKVSYFNTSDGKISGFDWNLWSEFKLSKKEFLAVLKHTYDLRFEGNRCPLTLGMHSDIYTCLYDDHQDPQNKPVTDYKEKKEALNEFLDYVLQRKETRIVSAIKLLDWLINPIPLV